ncbi:MAG: hypothetical protein HFF14_04950 [Angelakisella sp.]|nr:hypothetical protein [Angelakisella sp.]
MRFTLPPSPAASRMSQASCPPLWATLAVDWCRGQRTTAPSRRRTPGTRPQ